MDDCDNDSGPAVQCASAFAKIFFVALDSLRDANAFRWRCSKEFVHSGTRCRREDILRASSAWQHSAVCVRANGHQCRPDRFSLQKPAPTGTRCWREDVLRASSADNTALTAWEQRKLEPDRYSLQKLAHTGAATFECRREDIFRASRHLRNGAPEKSRGARIGSMRCGFRLSASTLTAPDRSGCRHCGRS
jgi:hypothetical protein